MSNTSQTKQNKRASVYDPIYISRREGISFEEAINFIRDYKRSKATSLQGFISRHGYNTNRFESSKRCEAYWLKHGYNKEEARYTKSNDFAKIPNYSLRGGITKYHLDHKYKGF